MLLRSKTQKITSVKNGYEPQANYLKNEGRKTNNRQLNQKEMTVPLNSIKQDNQVIRSISNTELNQRKIYYKQISAIAKKEFQITKCGGDIEEEKYPKIYSGREKNKYSHIESKVKQSQGNHDKNMLSIVDIGM